MAGPSPIDIRPSLALAALFVVLLSASPEPADAAGAKRVTSSPGSARDYWTAQRMSAAEPVDAATLAAGAPPSPGAELAGSPNRAAASYVSPAESGEPARARMLKGSPAERGRARRAGFVRDEIIDPSATDSRSHGKVFFTAAPGGVTEDFVCSATTVNSRNRNVVWTAGHCVFDSESAAFVSNWIFVPAYKDGVAPFGEWPARRLATTPGWQDSANLRYDLGAAVVAKNTAGQRLQAVVGARGIGFDQPRDQLFSIYGYPAVAPPVEFTGEREFRCISSLAGIDRPVGSGPATTKVDCDMRSGASGGGWIVGTTLLSVTSYSYPTESARLYGPQMSTGAKELYKSVRGKVKRMPAGRRGPGRRARQEG